MVGRLRVYDEPWSENHPIQKWEREGEGERKKREGKGKRGEESRGERRQGKGRGGNGRKLLRLQSQATHSDFQDFSMWNKTLVSMNTPTHTLSLSPSLRKILMCRKSKIWRPVL